MFPIFPELGASANVALDGSGWRDVYGARHPWVGIAPVLGFGARYHFGERTALLMRVSTPAGLQVGLVF